MNTVAIENKAVSIPGPAGNKNPIVIKVPSLSVNQVVLPRGQNAFVARNSGSQSVKENPNNAK